MGAWCLRSYQVSPRRAMRALRRDTAQAAANRKTMVRAVSICYNLSWNRRYRQGSHCHKPRSESLPRLNLIDSRRASPAPDPVRHDKPARERSRVRRVRARGARGGGGREPALCKRSGSPESRRTPRGQGTEPAAPPPGPRRRRHDHGPGLGTAAVRRRPGGRRGLGTWRRRHEGRGRDVRLCVLARRTRASSSCPGDVVLVVLSDEENGGDYGAKFLVEEHPELFAGIRHALGEAGGISQEIAGKRFYPIQLGEKQICWLKATVRGRGRPRRDDPPRRDDGSSRADAA